jgi:hypothetical protein
VVGDRGYSEIDGNPIGAELARWWGWWCGRSRRVGGRAAKAVGMADHSLLGKMSNRRCWNNSEQLWVVIWFSVLLRPRYLWLQKWKREQRVKQGKSIAARIPVSPNYRRDSEQTVASRPAICFVGYHKASVRAWDMSLKQIEISSDSALIQGEISSLSTNLVIIEKTHSEHRGDGWLRIDDNWDGRDFWRNLTSHGSTRFSLNSPRILRKTWSRSKKRQAAVESKASYLLNTVTNCLIL